MYVSYSIFMVKIINAVHAYIFYAPDLFFNTGTAFGFIPKDHSIFKLFQIFQKNTNILRQTIINVVTGP